MMRINKKMYDSDDIQSILNDLNADEIYRQCFMEIAQIKWDSWILMQLSMLSEMALQSRLHDLTVMFVNSF